MLRNEREFNLYRRDSNTYSPNTIPMVDLRPPPVRTRNVYSKREKVLAVLLLVAILGSLMLTQGSYFVK